MIKLRDVERIAYGLYKRVTFVNARKQHYLQVLKRLHEIVGPKRYFEIGVRRGHSLELAKCPAVGVDPAYDLLHPPRPDTLLVRQTSDDFFASLQCAEVLGHTPIDLAFIDGWHNCEFAIRDFMNTESYCSPEGVIVLDDVLPRTRDQAVRQPHGRAWTGDVWKAAECLLRHRPDLELTFIDCLPAGLMVVQHLDPKNTSLRSQYRDIEADLTAAQGPLMPSRGYRNAFCSAAKGLARVQGLRQALCVTQR